LRLAREALHAGGSAPTALNAANEVAVNAFLAGRIGFLDIVKIVEQTLEQIPQVTIDTLDCVAAVDQEARLLATRLSCDHRLVN
jgi:1-deoxy-D-xylulose-5-phosphate reductoisomerase